MEAHVEAFRERVDEFEDMLRAGKVKWAVVQNSFDFLCYLMVKHGYSDVSEIQRWDFKVEGIRDFVGIFNNKRYNGNMRGAIVDIINKTLDPPDNSRELLMLDRMAQRLEAFRTGELEGFEATLIKKNVKWTRETRFHMLLYIMDRKGYTDPRQIKAKDFELEIGNFKGIFISHKSHIKMMEDTVNDRVFPDESVNILTIDAGGETNPDRLFGMYLEKFKVGEMDAFVECLKASTWNNWDNESRFRLILVVCATNVYDDVDDIQHTDFTTVYGDFRSCYRDFGQKHRSMIKAVCKTKGILFDDDRLMTREEIAKCRREYLESAPLFTDITEAQWVPHRRATEVILQISSVIENGLQPIKVDATRKLGVCYVIRDTVTNDILYVGSTAEFHERKKTHIKDWFNPDINYEKPLYDHIRKTYDSWHQLEIVPVISCPVGFEVFVEADIYFRLKASQGKLYNGQAPTYSLIDDTGYIYWFRRLDTDEKFYVGSTNDFYQRCHTHRSHCYSPNLKKLYSKRAYQVIRELVPDATKFPKDRVAIECIERVPMWLIRVREQHYIEIHGTSNSVEADYSSEIVKQRQLQKHEMYDHYRKEKIKCQICNSCVSRNHMIRHMQEIHPNEV